MTRLARALIVTLSVVFFGSIIALFPQKNTSAVNPQPVIVTNTPLLVTANAPLPVSGNVNVSQSGTWTVGVSNFPAVQNVAFNGPQPVSFTNTTSTPVYNSDRDNAARQPSLGVLRLSAERKQWIPNLQPPSL